MRVAVLQSNYIPWKGYFDLMALADLFIVYDSVQYTKNDWRNRNQIASTGGLIWLTIPIATAGRHGQTIYEATISDVRWTRKHWNTISQNLSHRRFFSSYCDEWEATYSAARGFTRLHEVNALFLSMIARQIGIATPIVKDKEFSIEADSPTGKLVQLCLAVRADRYLSGPAGLNYLDLKQFQKFGIAVDVMDYGHYPEYDQSSGYFEHRVSALDLLASTGSDARLHLAGRFTTVNAIP